MHRPGSDQTDMQPTDFLCDFCAKAWDGQFPLVEGHQGSLICGSCLSVAFTELVHMELDSAPAGYKCTMCLEEREQRAWQSPVVDEKYACLRCIKQSATKLDKEPDWEWSKPVSPAG